MGFSWTAINPDNIKINDQHIQQTRDNIDTLYNDISCYSDNSTDKKYYQTYIRGGNYRTDRYNYYGSVRSSEWSTWASSLRTGYWGVRYSPHRTNKCSFEEYDYRWLAKGADEYDFRHGANAANHEPNNASVQTWHYCPSYNGTHRIPNTALNSTYRNQNY